MYHIHIILVQQTYRMFQPYHMNKRTSGKWTADRCDRQFDRWLHSWPNSWIWFMSTSKLIHDTVISIKRKSIWVTFLFTFPILSKDLFSHTTMTVRCNCFVFSLIIRCSESHKLEFITFNKSDDLPNSKANHADKHHCYSDANQTHNKVMYHC